MKSLMILSFTLFTTLTFANNNSCKYSRDNSCDDGGPGSRYAVCGLGTDLDDCGPRGRYRGNRDDRGRSRGNKQCQQELSDLEREFNQAESDWNSEKSRLLDRIDNLQRRLSRNDNDRNRRNRLQCAHVNVYGKYANGGGCNVYGCYYPGGGCNVYGCWSTGGSCNVYGCIKKASKTNKACND